MARRRKKKQKSIKGLVYTLVLIVAVCLGYEPLTRALHMDASKGLPAILAEVQKRLPETPQESTTTLGVPLTDKSLLPASLKDRPEKILVRRGYTVSYNLKHNLPNWVAWELTPDKLIERESRSDKFLPDPDLPEDVAVTTDDYKRSGWDRGHMCPAGDNRWHWRAMQESFYMTNICPQHHNLNRGDWKEATGKNWKRRAETGHNKKEGYSSSAAPSSTGSNTRPSATNIASPCPKPSSRSFFAPTATRLAPSASSTRTHRATIRWTAMSTLWTRWSASRASTSSLPCRMRWRTR